MCVVLVFYSSVYSIKLRHRNGYNLPVAFRICAHEEHDVPMQYHFRYQQCQELTKVDQIYSAETQAN